MMTAWRTVRFLRIGTRGLLKEPTLRSYRLMRLMMMQAARNLSWTFRKSFEKNYRLRPSKPKASWGVHTAPTIPLRNSMLFGFTERESPTHSSASCSKSLRKTLSAGAKTEFTERKVQAGKLATKLWRKKLSNGFKHNISTTNKLQEKKFATKQWNTPQRLNSSHPKDGLKISCEDTEIWPNTLSFDCLND